MILFDTNVISEAVRGNRDPNVGNWLLTCPADTICTTAINIAELRAGVSILPEGKRKSVLAENLETYLFKAFGDNILPFDAECTKVFAEIAAAMRVRGRAIGFADCQIAAIALHHGPTIATRDTQPFLDAGVAVVNPWAESKLEEH